MKFIIIVFLLLAAMNVFPQGKISGSVMGTIVDTAGKQDLSEATVSVTPISGDSSDILFSTTDKKGSFFIKNLHAEIITC